MALKYRKRYRNEVEVGVVEGQAEGHGAHVALRAVLQGDEEEARQVRPRGRWFRLLLVGLGVVLVADAVGLVGGSGAGKEEPPEPEVLGSVITRPSSTTAITVATSTSTTTEPVTTTRPTTTTTAPTTTAPTSTTTTTEPTTTTTESTTTTTTEPPTPTTVFPPPPPPGQVP